ncbi:ribosomal-processing cysteine protease Prp [Alkalihalobacillus sp. LMS39]|uniref:ribosomal-processing cysteine protease Prp n=1 Tax=Alkalihalobacillus sp. LMS39 TaxID=2924032 RepID=UPI001FB327C0|nr:ribosomal-processing cysteine protease Prp [Alkalihalobacillus sp. LMS39]UOE93286.1 ribosomal-processing cysteine protease Prp [Alkalihalobacillus sp. LMS39]
MIIVQVKRLDTKEIASFSMEGHANAGPYGSDIVCAGASAVTFGAVNAIAALLNTELEVEMKDEGGFLRCIVPTQLHEKTYEKVQLLLEGMVVALRSMEEEYGEHITITEL